MGITELLLIAIGLSMDAFAVSVCKGLATQKLKLNKKRKDQKICDTIEIC